MRKKEVGWIKEMTNIMSDCLINILIVDDKPEILFVLEVFLETIECNTITARSGNEALDYMQKCDFDLVLLDVNMQDMDGFRTADLMRGSERTKGIPIIFTITNSTEQWADFKGYEVGTVDYLLKPIAPVILRNKVRIFLDLYQQKKLLQVQTELLQTQINELVELRKINIHLENLSSLDGLTGIPNRRSFDQFIEMSWKNAIREQQPLSLIMIDVDHFKVYNDNYGHLPGDDCLILIAKTLASNIKRSIDLVARYGGEEFIAVLPNTDKEGALFVGERMRKSIEKLAMKHDQSQVADHVTISLGVTDIIPQPSDSMADFINSVDNALYIAKQTGRNKVYYEGSLSKTKTKKGSFPKKVTHVFLEKQLRKYGFKSVAKQKLSSANF